MQPSEEELYRSSNGDRWSLVREAGSDKDFVRHRANLASGGHVSLIGVDDFLAEGHGPQHEALVRLLEQRAENARAEPSAAALITT